MTPNAAKVVLVVGLLAVVLGIKVLGGAFFMGTFKTDEVLFGCAAGTGGFVLIAVGAAGLGWRWSGLAIAVTGIGVGAWYVLGLVTDVEARQHADERQIHVEDQLARACRGEPVPDAAPLAELGHGIRKALFLTTWDANNRPRAWVGDERWRPTAVADTQLVGCVRTGEDLVETCVGANRLISRKRQRLDGTLVEARTGKVIAEHVVHGGLPAECSTAGERSTDLVGSDPADDEVTRWARPFIVGAEAVP